MKASNKDNEFDIHEIPRAEDGLLEIPSMVSAMGPDPVRSDFDLPLHGVFYPLGFSVEIASNVPEVLAAAEESWGMCRKAFPDPPVHIQIGVVQGNSDRVPPPPVCRARRNLLTNISDAENFSVCDLRRGFAFSGLTKAAVSNRAYLRYYYLEGVALCLLESLYMTPLHAACVALGGKGVLLCGDSGAGKSSLALACARRGWTFISDDAASIVRNRSGRVVVGNPHQMRFRESAVELFPELKRQRVTPRVTGDLAIEVATASMPEIETTSECQVDYIVFLDRGGTGQPRISRYPSSAALRWFEQTICYGEKKAQEAQRASLRNLLTAELYELHYSGLNAAVRRLEAMVCKGAERPASSAMISAGD